MVGVDGVLVDGRRPVGGGWWCVAVLQGWGVRWRARRGLQGAGGMQPARVDGAGSAGAGCDELTTLRSGAPLRCTAGACQLVGLSGSWRVWVPRVGEFLVYPRVRRRTQAGSAGGG